MSVHPGMSMHPGASTSGVWRREPSAGGIEIGSIQRPAAGQVVCGDVFSILTSGSKILVAVADGLGHGPKAAEAATAFCAYVESHKDDGLEAILRGAHQHLARSRGAAAALVRIDEEREEIEFSGVGNIELRAESVQHISPVSVPGAIGINMRKTLLFRHGVSDGDILVVFSDGISSRMEIRPHRHLSPQMLAQALLDAFGKSHDDVTCLVIAYRRQPTAGVETFRVSNVSDAVWCRQEATRFARAIGFQGESLSQIAIAVSELATNAAKFATEALVTLRRLDGPRHGIEVVVDDKGPGILDVEKALQDGYSEGRFLANDDLIGSRRGMGTGLGAVKRMMSALELDNKPEGGLRVTARKWLSAR